MSKFEKAVGNIIAGGLFLIFVYSILATGFSLLFRDGRGIGLYGNRGEFYLSE